MRRLPTEDRPATSRPSRGEATGPELATSHEGGMSDRVVPLVGTGVFNMVASLVNLLIGRAQDSPINLWIALINGTAALVMFACAAVDIWLVRTDRFG